MHIYFTQEIISCVDNKGYLGRCGLKKKKIIISQNKNTDMQRNRLM